MMRLQIQRESVYAVFISKISFTLSTLRLIEESLVVADMGYPPTTTSKSIKKPSFLKGIN